MSGFHDLVPSAQPALVPDGCRGAGTEGSTWEKTLTGFNDANGTPVPWTGVTGTCTIYNRPVGGAVVTTLTVSFPAAGSLTISKAKAATAGLASGADAQGRRLCYWSLILDNGTDSVAVWTAPVSKFVIEKAA